MNHFPDFPMDISNLHLWAALTAAITAVACLALISHPRPQWAYAPLLLLTGTSAATFWWLAVTRATWTPESALLLECVLAALATIAGLLAAPGARWKLPLGCVVVIALASALIPLLPVTPRCGYRGLIPVDLTAALVLLVAFRVRLPDPLLRTATFWLSLHFAGQAVYASLWEFSFGVRLAPGEAPPHAVFVGTLAACGWCAAMFCIARAGFSAHFRRPENSCSASLSPR